MTVRLRPAVLVGLAALTLTACGTAAAEAPDWQPKPDAPYAAEPDAPTQAAPTPGQPSPSTPQSPGQSPSPGPSTTGPDPSVLATNLTQPYGLVLLPDGTGLVGERTTGRILQVQPVAGQPTPVVETVPGLDATGDGGLMDLAIAPTYDETGLVYAYVTTAAGNAVVTFTLGGPVTTVLSGIPKGPTGNLGRIGFDPNGDLLVATGTAGQPVTATSLNGKLLRYDDVGRAAADNPTAGSPVYTEGLAGAEALCAVPVDDAGPVGATVLIGSATDGGLRTADPGTTIGAPIATLPTSFTGLGGCAVQGQQVFVSSLDGKALLAADISAPTPSSLGLSTFKPTVRDTYGRLRTVVPAPDGSLWVTTSNKDGKGKPVATDDRVVKITPSGGGGGDSKA
ncbi:PQQ-dependent sugar dehydrogenase [Jatrophihabitans sp. YIM 134969]